MDVNSEEYKELQERLNKSELKLKTTREYFENILSHTEYKITGTLKENRLLIFQWEI